MNNELPALIKEIKEQIGTHQCQESEPVFVPYQRVKILADAYRGKFGHVYEYHPDRPLPWHVRPEGFPPAATGLAYSADELQGQCPFCPQITEDRELWYPVEKADDGSTCMVGDVPSCEACSTYAEDTENVEGMLEIWRDAQQAAKEAEQAARTASFERRAGECGCDCFSGGWHE